MDRSDKYAQGVGSFREAYGRKMPQTVFLQDFLAELEQNEVFPESSNRMFTRSLLEFFQVRGP